MRSIQRDDGENSVLGRALSLLHAFTPHDADLSLAELSRRTGIPKATVHRLVGELGRWGMVEPGPAGVHLGMRLFELGQLAPRQRSLREAALPYLNDLHEATHETVHLAVLEEVDAPEVVYLEKLTGKGGPALPSRVGGRMPTYCTAVGKALLAFSPVSTVEAVLSGGLTRLTPYTIALPALLHRELGDIRRSGVAFEREESTPGVVCVACPVVAADGSALAAVSIAGWSNRLDTGRVASAVRTASLAISRQLRARGSGPVS
ncbi:MAG: IclR family transcriptional regulator [Mycobacteriales bacterium]